MAWNNTSGNNSESPTFVWFDTSAWCAANETTRELLTGTLGNLTIMDDKSEYKRFFGRDFHNKRLVLIVSGTLGKEFIPKIHQLAGIVSIYIYCANKDIHKEWVKEYIKIKAVVTTLDDLVNEILSDR